MRQLFPTIFFLLTHPRSFVSQYYQQALGGAAPERSPGPARARKEISNARALTPSQLMRMKNDNLQSISTLAAQFGARMVDVSEHSVIVEMSGKTSKVEALLNLLKPFGLLESARTGESHKVASLLAVADLA